MIFQDPTAALDPKWSVSRIVGEPLRVRNQLDRREPSRPECPGDAGARRPRQPHPPSVSAPSEWGCPVARPSLGYGDAASRHFKLVAAARHLRRAGDGARRLYPSADPRICSRSSCARPFAHLPAHRARPRRRSGLGGPCRHDVPRNSFVKAVRRTLRSPQEPWRIRHGPHPALLSAIPQRPGAVARPRIRLLGEPPSPLEPPSGCRFRTRWRRSLKISVLN